MDVKQHLDSCHIIKEKSENIYSIVSMVEHYWSRQMQIQMGSFQESNTQDHFNGHCILFIHFLYIFPITGI